MSDNRISDSTEGAEVFNKWGESKGWQSLERLDDWPNHNKEYMTYGAYRKKYNLDSSDVKVTQRLFDSSTHKMINLILEERERQITKEGYSAAHDDSYFLEELARAASSYCIAGAARASHGNYCIRSAQFHFKVDRMGLDISVDLDKIAERVWPFDKKYYKPKSHKENLIRAAAFIVAELERLERADAKKNPDKAKS